MPKTQKQSGYLVKIEAFVPADMTDTHVLVDLQNRVDGIKTQLRADVASITPTRR